MMNAKRSWLTRVSKSLKNTPVFKRSAGMSSHVIFKTDSVMGISFLLFSESHNRRLRISDVWITNIMSAHSIDTFLIFTFSWFFKALLEIISSSCGILLNDIGDHYRGTAVSCGDENIRWNDINPWQEMNGALRPGTPRRKQPIKRSGTVSARTLVEKTDNQWSPAPAGHVRSARP